MRRSMRAGNSYRLPSIVAVLLALSGCGVDEPRPARPQYEIHNCLRLRNAEAWDPTFRIEMVGKARYLVREYPASLWRAQEGWSLGFTEAHNYLEVVECPKPENHSRPKRPQSGTSAQR